jgi:hypothetical protein
VAPVTLKTKQDKFIAVYENMNICVVRPPTLGSQRHGMMRRTVKERAGMGSFFPFEPRSEERL